MHMGDISGPGAASFQTKSNVNLHGATHQDGLLTRLKVDGQPGELGTRLLTFTGPKWDKSIIDAVLWLQPTDNIHVDVNEKDVEIEVLRCGAGLEEGAVGLARASFGGNSYALR